MDIEELLYKCAPSNTRSLAGTNQHMGYLFSLLSNPDAEERSGASAARGGVIAIGGFVGRELR